MPSSKNYKQPKNSDARGGPRRLRVWLPLCIVLLAGVLLRASYLRELVEAPDFSAPPADAAFHDYWARAIATGDWTPPGNSPDPMIPSSPYVRPPAYPFFLAMTYLVVGPGYLAPRIVQMALGMVNCVLAFILGRSIFGRSIGVILAAFMSVYWAFIYFEGELLAPVLAVFLALSMMILLRRWVDKPTYLRAAVSGLQVGIFCLCRPNALLFIPVVVCWMWWVRRRRNAGPRGFLMPLTFLLGATLTILPATIRNYVVAKDVALISCNGAINFYIGNNVRSDGVTTRIPDLEEIAGVTAWSCFSYAKIVDGVGRLEGRPMKHSEVSAYFSRKAMDFIRSHPSRALALAWKRALLFWGPAEISNNKAIYYERQNSTTLRYLPRFPAVLSLSLLGIVIFLLDHRSRKVKKTARQPQAAQRFQVCVLIILLIAVYSCSFVPFLVVGRFRVPIIPFLLLFAAYGAYRLAGLAAARDLRRTSIWAVVWIALYILAGTSFVTYEPSLAWWHHDRGEAYERGGNINRAIDEYKQALQAKPDYIDVHLTLAAALAKQGKIGEAAEHCQTVTDILPSLAKAQYQLGLFRFAQGRMAEAAGAFRRTVELEPDNVRALIDFGVALSRQGNRQQAAAAYRKAIEVDPFSAKAHYGLASALAKLGDTDQAIHHYQLTLKIDPVYIQARINLGGLFARKNRTAEAIEQYRQALRLDPDSFEGHYNLASALATKGRTAEAIRELREALRIRPGHPDARRAMETLMAQQRNKPSDEGS